MQDFGKFLRKVPGFAHCYAKLKKLQPNLVSQLTRWERSESTFPLTSVLHGELWEKNILLRCELVSSDLEVAFCDWKGLKVRTAQFLPPVQAAMRSNLGWTLSRVQDP